MKKFLLIFIFSISIYGVSKEIPNFRLLTEELRPFNYSINKKAYGISIEILNEIFRRLDSKQNAINSEFFPWARAYYISQNERMNILFVTARTKDRERLFKWVGPIFSDKIEAFALKKRNIQINDISDFQKYRISTYIGDSQEELINKLGIPIESLDRLISSEARFKKLYSGRSDIIIASRIVFFDYLNSNEINTNTLDSIYELDSIDICYAFSLDTPDWVVDKFQEVIMDLHKDGTINKIYESYNFDWVYNNPYLKFNK